MLLPYSIIEKFTPKIYLHSNDIYKPASVPWYLWRSNIISTDNPESIIAQAGMYSQHKLFLSPNSKLSLIDPKFYTGEDNINKVPFYVKVKYIDDHFTNGKAWDISYIQFYPYNGPLLGKFGAHEGDWEHITVRLKPLTYELIAVWYNNHRNKDGQWVKADKVPKDENDTIIAYSSLNSHGLWPTTGMQPRILFFGSDFTNKGTLWYPKQVIILPYDKSLMILKYTKPNPKDFPVEAIDGSSQLWIQYKGDWGTMWGPSQQPWFENPEPTTSSNWFHRLFCFI